MTREELWPRFDKSCGTPQMHEIAVFLALFYLLSNLWLLSYPLSNLVVTVEFATTVKPPNNGHIGTTNFVRYTEMSVARRVQRSRAYLMS